MDSEARCLGSVNQPTTKELTTSGLMQTIEVPFSLAALRAASTFYAFHGTRNLTITLQKTFLA